MDSKLLEHWKLFYDTTKAMFVLSDKLVKNYDWFYQELFYIKLFSFLDESPNYIAKCHENFGNNELITEWLQHISDWRGKMFEKLSENWIIYIQYRRTRAAHMFQYGFEYEAYATSPNNIRIVCKEGGRRNYARANVDAIIKTIEAGYSNSYELDRDFDRRIHPTLNNMRLDLNNIYNSLSMRSHIANAKEP